MPDFLVPYKRYSSSVILSVINNTAMEAPADEQVRQKIKKWYRRIHPFLVGIWNRLMYLDT